MLCISIEPLIYILLGNEANKFVVKIKIDVDAGCLVLRTGFLLFPLGIILLLLLCHLVYDHLITFKEKKCY